MKTQHPREPVPVRWPVHHLLLATFPALAVYVNNIGGVGLVELLLALVVSLGVAAVLWGLLMAWLRDACQAAVATSWSLIAMLLFSHGVVQSAAERMGNPYWIWYAVVALWISTTIVGVAWFLRAHNDLRSANTLLTMFSIVLVSGPLLKTIYDGWFNSLPVGQRLETTLELADVQLSPVEPRRDVYYLVFDRYADQQTLLDDFGFDNQSFLQQLRGRGFAVATRSRANYCKTDLSMSSALNMQYHTDVMHLKEHYVALLRNHLVGRLFKQQAYRYYHYGNLLDGIRDNRHADYNYRFSVMPTEFSESVLRTTALCHLLPPKGARLQEEEKFALLVRNASAPGPKFVYAHFLLPHGPWKFDRDGTPVLPQQAARRSERENYVRQLEYTNARILATIDAILARSPIPPVIILQADEGPELKYEHDAEKNRLQRMRKRLGILSAFYLPGRDASKLVGDDITPVNTFRLVLREYFGAEIPLLTNRCFYWDPDPGNVYGKPELHQQRQRTYRLVNVTDAVYGCVAPAH